MIIIKAIFLFFLIFLILPIQSHTFTGKKREYYHTYLCTYEQPNNICIEIPLDKKSEKISKMESVEEIFKEIMAITDKIEYKHEPSLGWWFKKNKREKTVFYAYKAKNKLKEGSCFEKAAVAMQWLRENGYSANLCSLAVYMATKSKFVTIRSKHLIVLLYLKDKRYIIDPTHNVFFENGQDYTLYLNSLEPKIYEIKFYPFQKVNSPIRMSLREERRKEDEMLPKYPETYFIK